MKRFVGATLLLGLFVGANAEEGLFEISAQPDKREAVEINYKGNSMNVYSGPVAARFNGGTTFDAYCVDLDHWNSMPAAYQVKTSPINHLQYGERAAYLYNTFAGQVNSKTKGAALQLAIWDVVTDNGDGLSDGQFKGKNVSQGVKDLANSYINQSANQTGVATLFEAIDHGRDGKRNQDFMGPVPEPATMAVLGLGITALLRRRNKK